MTNRNRNIKNKPKKKNYEKKNGKHEEREERKGMDARIVIDIIPIIVSCFALVVSGITLCVNYYFNNKEYEYKIDPEVEVTGKIGLQIYHGNQKNAETFLKDLQIHILQKNNLQEAYLIFPNNTVEKLVIDDMEEQLMYKLNKDLKVNRADLTYGDISYQYEFLFLKGLDNTSELYLIYTKANGDIFNFSSASGIEIWGLANSHPGDEAYTGEKVMAKQYQKILNESEKYIL